MCLAGTNKISCNEIYIKNILIQGIWIVIVVVVGLNSINVRLQKYKKHKRNFLILTKFTFCPTEVSIDTGRYLVIIINISNGRKEIVD